MRKLLFALALALLAPCAASAQTATPGLPLIPLGNCQLTTALASAGGLSACAGAYSNGSGGTGGIPLGANAVVLRAETQAVRYTDDGVSVPTSSFGQPILTTDAPVYYQGAIANLSFIQQTASAKLDVSFYRAR